MAKIQEMFEELKAKPSDINEHLQTLCDLAKECEIIVEMGVRTWLSTIALLAWLQKGAKLISIDFEEYPQIDWIRQQAKKEKKNFRFVLGDTREIQIQECDLLWIDTLHNASQLEIELKLHADKARKYLAFHDVVTFWTHWETEDKGLMYAITEFLEAHKEWTIEKLYENNNWLLLLKRI